VNSADAISMCQCFGCCSITYSSLFVEERDNLCRTFSSAEAEGASVQTHCEPLVKIVDGLKMKRRVEHAHGVIWMPTLG
jgi:hypothetical protein